MFALIRLARPAAALAFVSLAACAGGIVPEELPEGAGAVEMRLRAVPADARCVVLYTSDYRRSYVEADVVPGEDTTIRVAPLSAGWVSLRGEAYDVPCDERWTAYDAGAGSSSTGTGSSSTGTGSSSTGTGGGVPPYPGSTSGTSSGGTTGGFTGGSTTGGWMPHLPTWEAQPIYVTIRSGATEQAQLVFRRPGALDVDVDFEEGPSDDGGAGPDGGPYPGDGGAPFPGEPTP